MRWPIWVLWSSLLWGFALLICLPPRLVLRALVHAGNGAEWLYAKTLLRALGALDGLDDRLGVRLGFYEPRDVREQRAVVEAMRRRNSRAVSR